MTIAFALVLIGNNIEQHDKTKKQLKQKSEKLTNLENSLEEILNKRDVSINPKKSLQQQLFQELKIRPDFKKTSGNLASQIENFNRNEDEPETQFSTKTTQDFEPDFKPIKRKLHGLEPTENFVDDLDFLSELVILVVTRRENFLRREMIRKTWAKNEKNVIFLVGNACPWPETLLEHKNFCNHPNMSTSQLQGWRNEVMDYRVGQKNITLKISKEKRDVKIVDVVDTPIYLNKKLQHGFKFVIENFPMAKYVAKVNDDSYVRPKKLLQWMRSEERKNFTLIAKEFTR